MVLKLVLPKNLLTKGQYSALSAFQKSEYINNLLRQILELNPNGVTVSQIDKDLKLGHSTVWHHLEKLSNKTYCLKMERGDTAVYNFNKLVHTLDDCDIQGKYYLYDFDVVENIFDKFLRIQIKQENSSGNLVAHGGIIINTDFLSNVLDALVTARDKLKKIK